MKILFTTQYLDNYAGSELFTRDVTTELMKRGHQVFVFSPVLGKVAKEMISRGVSVTNDLLEYKNMKFDVIHAQHNVTAILARSVFPTTSMVFMAHGVKPRLEQPPSLDIGIEKYITVSDEVQLMLNDTYKIPETKIEIIRNSVTNIISNTVNNKKLSNVLVISNHYEGHYRDVVEKACSDLGLKITHIGRPSNPVKDVYPYILKSDIVITIGRGVLESIASGKNVIAYDVYGGDGLITKENFFEARKHNFSGRRYKINYNISSFKEELQKYDPSIMPELQEILAKDHMLSGTASMLEQIYIEAKNAKVASVLKKEELYNEIIALEEVISLQKEAFAELANTKDILAKITGSKIWKMRNFIAPFFNREKY